MPGYPVASLLNLSLYEVTNIKNLTTYTWQLSFLPPNLKDPIRRVLLKRGAPTEIIKSLIHPKIRSLDLSECEKTEEMLSRVRETCGHLRKLSVNCTEAEESYGLSEALSLLLKKNIYLSVMSVRNFSSVDDSVLLNISKFLSELDLGGCSGVSDAGISGLLERCAALTSLSLNRTPISDRSLTALGLSSCRASLKELNVSSCRNISDQGIEDLLVGLKMNDNIPVLNIFIFHKCPQLTETSRLLVDYFFSENHITAKQLSWTIY